jgi:uncharacterized small protein (DUF1192 family)
MVVRIKLRRDTTQNWYEQNPILSDGEIGLEQLSDGSVKIKIGNGTASYKTLPYFADTISFLDLTNKPSINGVVLKPNLSLADLGIQPIGNYALGNEMSEKLALKADLDKTYSRNELDRRFDDLVKVPSVEHVDNKYLKTSNGEIYWANIEGDIITTEELKEALSKKVDAINGYSLISDKEIKRLASIDNYNDSIVKEDIKLLKEEVDTKATINSLEDYVLEKSLKDTLENYATIADNATKANASEFYDHISDQANPHNITKAQIGLDNVDNTSDMDKPISSKTQEALDNKQNLLTSGYGITINGNTITNSLPNTQSDWNASTGNSLILNKPILSAVATSGSYNDLVDKPYIPTDYVLPIASNEVLGGLKLGNYLEAEEDGTVNVNVPLDYALLDHKPSIGGITLIEGQTAEDLDLATAKATQSALNLKANKSYVNDLEKRIASLESEIAELKALITKNTNTNNEDN